MKGIVIYHGKYGSTEQYARWLAEELGLTVVPLSGLKDRDLNDYQLVIVGSCVRIGKIMAAGWMNKHWPALKGKIVFFYSVSGTSPVDKSLQKIMENCLNKEIRDNIYYYPLPGRLSLTNLSGFDKLLINIGARMEKIEQNGDVEQSKEFDYVVRANIQALLNHVRKYLNGKENTDKSSP